MKQKITDTHLQAAARRYHAGETLTQIAEDMGFAYGTLVSAKHRRAELWRDTIALIASQKLPPRTELQSERSKIKTLMNSIAAKEAEIQKLRDALKKEKENHKRTIQYYSEAIPPL